MRRRRAGRRQFRSARSSHRTRYRNHRWQAELAHRSARNLQSLPMPKLANLDRVAHQNLRVLEERAFAACKDITHVRGGAQRNSATRHRISDWRSPSTAKPANSYVSRCLASTRIRICSGGTSAGTASLCRSTWRGSPFSSASRTIRPAAKAAKGLVTCIDLENPGVQDIRGRSAVRCERRRDSLSAAQMTLLAELVDGEQTIARIRRSSSPRSSCIQPIQLELKVPGQPPRKISGLYSIDETETAGARLAQHSRSCNEPGLSARDVRDAVVARAPADPCAPRPCADTGEYLSRLEPKKKPPPLS